MRLRKHRHRWVTAEPDGLVQRVYCKTRGCGYAYEQYLLFDLAAFGRAA